MKTTVFSAHKFEGIDSGNEVPDKSPPNML